VASGESGTCYTRTGRRFFEDGQLAGELVALARDAIGGAGWWDQLDTDWVCLDAELMPWSAKAQDLLRRQYAPVGAAAGAGLSATVDALAAAAGRGLDLGGLPEAHRARATMAARYTAAYSRYCWPVEGIADLRLAPFHVLASEGSVHTDKTHDWHMARAAELAEADPALMVRTATREVDLADPGSEAAATEWWEKLTGAGGEGMVVKPADFVARGGTGLVQPAVKCRGVEYLRIIYGPTYTEDRNLERLRSRGLGAERSMAMLEFALGIEALERFVAREPLRRVHECVFAVLALESEPVDPRL
jgi:protein phosphatase